MMDCLVAPLKSSTKESNSYKVPAGFSKESRLRSCKLTHDDPGEGGWSWVSRGGLKSARAGQQKDKLQGAKQAGTAATKAASQWHGPHVQMGWR
jgi:hypothetical protein